MSSPRSHIIAQLQQALRRCEGARRAHAGRRTSTGCPELDRLLPEGGLGRGTLVEWLAAASGSGALWLALTAAREACREYGPLVVIDHEGTFYPPAAARAGLAPDELIVVHVSNARDESWALDQALRSAGVGAVLCSTRRLSQAAGRRLQLAAETSGGLGLLVRPASVRDEPCWAEARLLVEPLPAWGAGVSPASTSSSPGQAGRLRHNASETVTLRRVRVELLRARGSLTEPIEGRRLELEIDDETGFVRVVGRLAATAPRESQPGAAVPHQEPQPRAAGPHQEPRAAVPHRRARA